jgi:hypothetical protein
LTHAVEALAKSLRHCSSHRLAGFASEFLGEFVSSGSLMLRLISLD